MNHHLARRRLRRHAAKAVVFAALLLAAAPAGASEAAGAATAEEAVQDAEVLQLAGDFAAAVKVLKSARGAEGDDLSRRKALAIALIRAGEGQEALEVLQGLFAPEEVTAEALLWSAVASAAAGQDAMAAGCLEEGLEKAGEDETALYDLAEIFLRAGAPAVSAALYRKVLEVDPTDTMFDMYSTLHLVAYLHFMGRETEAGEMLAAARGAMEYSDISIMAPQQVDYHAAYLKGLGEVRSGNTDAGVATLRDAAAIFADSLPAQGAVVKSLDGAGRSQEAAAAFGIVARKLRREIAAGPESAEARYNFALFAQASGREPGEGLRNIEWALTLAPLEKKYMVVRALLLARLGRYDEALKFANQAVAMDLAPRWSEAGVFDYAVFARIEILEAMERALPRPLVKLP